MHSYIRLPIVISFLFLAGCATRYVERDPSKEEASDGVGDVVVSKASEEYRNQPPTCLAVLPMQATNEEFYPTEEVRKAVYSHLAPTGIRLIALQKIDAIFDKKSSTKENISAINAATGCDGFIDGEVFDKNAKFYGIYSEVRIGAKLKVLRNNSDKAIWEGKHTAVVRDGGIPLNPISAVATVVSAGANLRKEQITRTTHDLARRLVFAIPGLKYQDDVEIRPIASRVQDRGIEGRTSLDVLKERIANKDQFEIESILVNELSVGKIASQKDREEILELLIAKAPNNPYGYAEMTKIKLSAGHGTQAVDYAKKLIAIEPRNPDNQFLLGRAYLKSDMPDEAVGPLLRAAGADIPKAVYFSGLGIAYSQQGKYELAIAAYRRSIELDANNQFTLIQLGMAHAFAGQEAQAAKVIRKSIVLSIANNEKNNAESGLNALTSLGLEGQLDQTDLNAIQEKIKNL